VGLVLRSAIALDDCRLAEGFPHILGGGCGPDGVTLAIDEQRPIGTVELCSIRMIIRTAAEMVAESGEEAGGIQRARRILVYCLKSVRSFENPLVGKPRA
jgi:hypothetical protein